MPLWQKGKEIKKKKRTELITVIIILGTKYALVAS